MQHNLADARVRGLSTAAAHRGAEAWRARVRWGSRRPQAPGCLGVPPPLPTPHPRHQRTTDQLAEGATSSRQPHLNERHDRGVGLKARGHIGGHAQGGCSHLGGTRDCGGRVGGGVKWRRKGGAAACQSPQCAAQRTTQ